MRLQNAHECAHRVTASSNDFTRAFHRHARETEMYGTLSHKSLLNVLKVTCFIILCKLYNVFVAASDDDKLTDMQIAKAAILGVAAFAATDAIAGVVARGTIATPMSIPDVAPAIPKLSHVVVPARAP